MIVASGVALLAFNGCVVRREPVIVYRRRPPPPVIVQSPAVVATAPAVPAGPGNFEAVPQPTEAPVIAQAPPAPQVEVMPPAPSVEYVWAPGYWSWRGAWVWVPGRWAFPPRPHAVWVEGRWVGYRRGWRYAPGHWR
jgi:WXXGXW repeat (2 copies)